VVGGCGVVCGVVTRFFWFTGGGCGEWFLIGGEYVRKGGRGD
jgi:hypothetical protein